MFREARPTAKDGSIDRDSVSNQGMQASRFELMGVVPSAGKNCVFANVAGLLATGHSWPYGLCTMNRLALVWYASLTLGCAPTTTARLRLPPLETVAHVELQRYLGTWYEISSFPQSFQKGCTATTATYARRADGEIDVVNRCRKDSLDGPEKTAMGRARIVDQTTNAKLEVSFFRPFWGDYWIIDLGDDYDYAVVGHPSRDYLWILSRTPTMDDMRYTSIVRKLASRGYETGRLNRTLQPVSAPSGTRGSLSSGAAMPLRAESNLDERRVDAK